MEITLKFVYFFINFAKARLFVNGQTGNLEHMILFSNRAFL